MARLTSASMRVMARSSLTSPRMKKKRDAVDISESVTSAPCCPARAHLTRVIEVRHAFALRDQRASFGERELRYARRDDFG